MLLVNTNAMVDFGTNHKEETRTEFSVIDDATNSLLDVNNVSLSMETNENYIYGVDFGKGNSKSVDISYYDIYNQITKYPFLSATNTIPHTNFKENELDKVINQIPDNVFLESKEHPYQFYMNQKEYDKIKYLLDVNKSYRSFKVVVLDKSPKDLIFLRRKAKSDFF